MAGAISFGLRILGWLHFIRSKYIRACVYASGGLLADRFDRKKVALVTQGIQFLFVLLMLILLVTGRLKVWMIIVTSFIVGLTDALCNPSLQTIIPSLVDRKSIPRAVSLSSTQFNLSRILGPAIAGIVIARFGTTACFTANACSYIPFFIAISFVYPGRKSDLNKEPLQYKPLGQLPKIKELLHIHDVHQPLITVFCANLFCGPLVTFCSVLVKDTFHSGVGNFGWAMTAFGCGALIGAAGSFIKLPASFGRNRLASAVAIFQGFFVVCVALNHSYLLLYFLLVLAGTAQILVNISVNAFLQENATDNLRGRVASLYQLAMYSGVAIGALLTGFMVSEFNISDAFLLNGSLAVVFQLFFVWKKAHKVAGKK